jgi:hypothetical protein
LCGFVHDFCCSCELDCGELSLYFNLYLIFKKKNKMNNLIHDYIILPPSQNNSRLMFVYDFKEMINCVDFNGKISII